MAMITLRFDAACFEADAELADAGRLLFETVAESLDCFYADARVERGWTRRGRTLYLDGETEARYLFPGRWIGLPPVGGSWLTWFGRPYVPLVAEHLDARSLVERDNGLVLRLSRQPLDQDQADEFVPTLPGELFPRPDPRYPGAQPSLPAVTIPPLL